MPDSGRDTKIFRAYKNCVSWECNPTGINASTTANEEFGVLRCAAKAVKKFIETEGDLDEIETRLSIRKIRKGIWLAQLK